MSPTQRTLAALRADGWTAAVVERWNPHARVRHDLGGFADVLAWAPARGILAVQATTGDHIAARVGKVRAEPRASVWTQAGGRLEVWGWRKSGPRGKRKVWTCRKVVLDSSGTAGEAT